MNMLPMPDFVVKLEISGEKIIKVLEIGVSRYPSLEGRFPAVSGLTFSFNGKGESFKKIIRESVKINDLPVIDNHLYSMACKLFIASGKIIFQEVFFIFFLIGKDGYDVLSSCKRLIDENKADEIEIVLEKFFGK